MLILLSPAKTLDFEKEVPTSNFTRPDYMDASQKLIKKLRKFSKKGLMELMDISENLAELNYERYAKWEPEFTPDNAKQSIFAFKGDVYQGIEIETFSEEDLAYAQDHIRILSGLYGLLRPLDLIQPYRLEMGTNLEVNGDKNLYEFWDDELTKDLNKVLDQQDNRIIFNLASKEYFSAVNTKKLDAQLIEPSFKDWKNGRYMSISFYLKKARGMMAAWIIKHRITDPEELKSFAMDGYAYDPELSEDKGWVFSRKEEE